MAGTFLGKYDTTSANNTVTGTNSVSVAEGMLPSNINNAFRSVMADIRQHYNNAEWIEYGDGAGAYTPAYVSGTSFTIAGVNVTAIYHVGRRVKVVASTPGTIYGSITAVAFSTNTTVTVSWDSGNLSDEAITSVFIGVLAETNSSIPIGVIEAVNLADSAVTTAKINADAITSAKIADDAIDSEHYTNGSIDTAHIGADQIVASLIADNAIDSEHYTDGSIDTAHIADDQITTAKIPDSAITSAKIADGAIVNADINASAAIALSKLENLTTARALVSDGSGDVSVSAVTSTEVGYLDGVSSAIQTQLDAKQDSDADLTAIGNLAKTDGNLIVGNGSTWVAESGATARTSLGLGSIATQAANNVSISGGSVTGLGEPSSNSDASTKSYVDQAVAGLRTRTIAECASTANVNISNALEAGDAIDGVTLVAGDRVLLKNQSTATENGLYIAVGSGAGAASRDPEHDTIAELSGGMVVVNQGTANDNKIFLCTTDSDGSLGSTSITYTVITPNNSGTVTSIVAGTGLSGGTITSAGTIAIDTGTTVDKTTAQTLTNKTLTSPKINENVAVTSTATELNLLDGKAATNLALIGKQEGTNFTNSLLVGHATTGTLNDANSNTGVGINTLKAITSADSSTVIGYNAGDAITSGSYNTVVGRNAGSSINTGSKNTSVGWQSGQTVQGGARNTTLGANSGALIAAGNNNITIGENAGDNITSGDGNVIIGGINADSATGDKQLIVADGVDGSVAWIKGSSAGAITFNGAYTFPTADGSADQILKTNGSGALSFAAASSADFSSVGEHILPTADDTYNLGSATKQWANIYTGDLHLSNESKSEGNIVDGTTGNWTIQEGSEDLFILNNKSGKKYKFKLEEV